MAFVVLILEPSFIASAASWQEQRQFVYTAIEALGDHSVVPRIMQELQQLKAKQPDLRGTSRLHCLTLFDNILVLIFPLCSCFSSVTFFIDFVQVSNPSQIFNCASKKLSIGIGADGSIVHLDYKGVSTLNRNDLFFLKSCLFSNPIVFLHCLHIVFLLKKRGVNGCVAVV